MDRIEKEKKDVSLKVKKRKVTEKTRKKKKQRKGNISFRNEPLKVITAERKLHFIIMNNHQLSH